MYIDKLIPNNIKPIIHDLCKKIQISYETIMQFILYCIIGAFTFLVDVGVFSFSFYQLHFSTQLSVSTSYIFALFVHFTLNKFFNFQNCQRHTIAQSRTYIIIVILNYSITMLLMSIFVDYMHFNPPLSKGFAVILNALWGFPAQKYLTFSHGIRKVIIKFFNKF